MQRNVFFIFVLFLLVDANVWAETIYLKNGKVVKGEIREKGSYYVVIQSGDVPYKYYMDEVARIEKDEPVAETPTRKVVPVEKGKISMVKLNLIKQLIEVNGTKYGIQQNFQQILARVAEKDRTEINKMLNVDEIITRLIPVYDKYFTEQDLTELIRFYQSPIGLKTIAATPLLAKDALRVTLKYFKEKVEDQK